MEDDNVNDILKWMFSDTTKVDREGTLRLVSGGSQGLWEVKLKGNILALRPGESELVEEPFIIVCERIRVSREKASRAEAEASSPLYSFEITLDDGNSLRFLADSEAEAEDWSIKLALCSHQMAQVELDEAMQQHLTLSSCSPTPSTSMSDIASGADTSRPYFLTSPLRKEHVFNVYQSTTSCPSASRRIECSEMMYESKLSLVLPLDMVKLFIRQSSDLRDELLGQLWNIRNSVAVEALHNAVRHLNSNIEVYTQAVEFLDSYSGPSFRPSKEKLRVAFAPVPTNLHVQYFQVGDTPAYRFLTSGAIAALPLRFTNGGLCKIRSRFLAGLDATAADHVNELRFNSRQNTLLNAKRRIGEITRRMDREDWVVTQSNDHAVNRAVAELFSQVKELYATLRDMVSSFPNISNLVDAQCEGGHAQKSAGPRDNLTNQLDFLDAMVISLGTKMAAIVSAPEREKALIDNAKSALHSTLDSLLQLVESLSVAQLLGFVLALRNPLNCQTYFHLQLRHDLLLSQAVTLVTTALLTWLTGLDEAASSPSSDVELQIPLIVCFSFLSCYGNERGMMEDMREVWSTFERVAKFRFIASKSAVSQTCIPQIESPHRMELRVSIPLPASTMSKLPVGGTLANGEFHPVRVAFFNLGVNHEASIAASMGDVSLEESINRNALSVVLSVISQMSGAKNDAVVHSATEELVKTVTAESSRKNIQIFTKAMALTAAVGGIACLACKSGKDRTSMAATWEEGRLLKEQCGISQQQMFEIVDNLRRNGVRRENCRKNVGKALYSFSPFQLHFLPREFRPPPGTFTQMVAS